MKNKKILITGGTGSFGQSMTSFLLKKYKLKKIIIYSRDEQKQFQMQKKFPENKYNIRYFIGDVRDKDRLTFAMKGIDYVIHSAALKHVSLGEYNPFEVVKTNIMGSQNVIDSSIQNKVSKVIALSTDKASSPTNLYGASKLTSDKLFINANNYKGRNSTIFSVVRYGNVMGSKGSVIPNLITLAKNKETVNLTDKNMTRFNITLEDGVSLVDFVFKNMLGGEMFVPKLKSYKILDLIKAICPNNKVKVTGIRPGEKIHEEMISEHEAENTLEFKKYFIIMPSSIYYDKTKISFKRRYKNFKNVHKNFAYRSNINSFLTVAELKELIKKNFYSFVF